MERLYKLKEKLCQELDEIAEKKEMGAGDLELAHKLTDTIKNIGKICMLEDEGGYSQAGEGDGSYGRGNSYANRGQHWVRGHYSRENRSVRRDNMGGYSRDDGRSVMMEHLEMAMDAANDRDRENIKRWIRQLENA